MSGSLEVPVPAEFTGIDRGRGEAISSPIRAEAVACNNCGGMRTTAIGGGWDFEYETSRDEFPVVRCEDCGLVYLSPRPQACELPRIYPQDYLAYNLSADDQTNSNRLACRLRRRVYTSKIRSALALLPHKTGEVDFLDVGAGDGRLLNWYRQIPGYRMRTHAVEMNAQAAGALVRQGHQVYQGRFEELDLPQRSFDVIHSSHVIEHLADPRGFAAKSRELLRIGGLFIAETPNLDCPGARLFARRYWGGYHFPRHWTFYTPETITDALQKAGLRILRIKFCPNPVFWVWTVHHWLKEQGLPSGVVEQLFPAVGIFDNSFANVLRLGAFTVVERALGFAWRGRMGSMQVIAGRED